MLLPTSQYSTHNGIKEVCFLPLGIPMMIEKTVTPSENEAEEEAL